MRLIQFATDADPLPRVGILRDQLVYESRLSWVEALGLASSAPETVLSTAEPMPVESCRILPPLANNGRGPFCVGLNYADHDAEASGLLRTESPDHPVIFSKLASAMVAWDAPLLLDPLVSQQFDWELELGVVIGRAGRNIAPERVREHLAGYVMVNDVTARDLQRKHGQWLIGKSVDGSSPIGPWVATIDELGYPAALEMVLTVNGVEKQRGKTLDMLFDISTLVASLSRVVELQVGDILATGTPAGVGFARQPPEFLEPGDLIEGRITGLGLQRNVVVLEPPARPKAT